MALAELPARALPDRVAADFGLDLGVVHPGIVVPGRIVGAHMLEAEPVVAVEFEPRAGRAKIAAMQPGWSQGRTGTSAVASRVGSARGAAFVSMGGRLG